MEFDTADLGRAQHDIGNVITARVGIESDKISERRKHAGSLKELLQLPHILNHIDSSAHTRGGDGLSRPGGRGRGGRSGSTITWVLLFRSILMYVEKETDSIGKLEEKGTSSASAISNRMTRKKDVAEMIRVYVRAANKRTSLPVSEVISHMRSVLENKTLGAWFGNDYSQVLLNYILSVPEYVVQLTAQQWDELISLYCRLFLSTESSINKALVAKIIHSLISHLTLQTDIPIYKLHCFFGKALPNIIKDERNTQVLEHLLAAFNTFSSSSAVYNARGRLSSLGEDILPNILSLWSKVTRPIREQMITFLRTQLCIHHPLGRHTDEKGAWACNDRIFKKNLEKLYDIIIADFESSSTRLRLEGKSEGSRPFALLDLAVDVVYQTMYIRDNRESTADPTIHRGKRLKAQTCWGTLRDALSTGTDEASLVSWLQLISWLISKWPDSLPTEDHLPLLKTLCKLLRETKRSDYIKWLFVCLYALALNPTTQSATSSHHHGSTHTRDLWRKVWLSTMKILSVRTAEYVGYNLLTLLLELGLVECDMEPWKLLNMAFNLPIRPIVSFIASILQNHTLPDRLLPYMTTPLALPTIMPTQSSASNDHTLCYSSYPLRTQLLQFLIPLSLAVVGGAGVESLDALRRIPHGTMRLANSTSPALLAHVLVSLTQRSYSSAKLSFLKSLYMPSSSSSYVQELLEAQSEVDTHSSQDSRSCNSEGDHSNDFEQVYLESSFDVPLVVPCLTKDTKEPLVLSRENTIVVLQSLLLDLLSKRSELLLQPTDFQTTLSLRERCQHLSLLLETQAHHCSVVLHTLLLLCHCETFDPLRTTPFLRTLTVILTELTTSLKSSLWSEVERPFYYKTVRTVLKSLQPLVHFSHLDTHQLSSPVAKTVMVARELIVKYCPIELMEMVQKLAQGKCPILPNHSLTSSSTFSLCESSRSESRRPSETASSRTSDSPLFDDDMELSESATFAVGDSGPCDILSVSTLNPKSVCQLDAARFLCYCYKNSVAAEGRHGSSHEDAAVFDYKSALLSMLTEEQDLKKAVNVQIVFESVHVLANGGENIEPTILDALMDVFGQVLSVHRKNQCVYLESLQKLSSLSSHLCCCGPGEEATNAREKCQTLISAFWGLYLEGSLSSRVRLKLAQVIQALFEGDRSNTWTSIIVKKKRKKGEAPSEQSLGLRDALIQIVNDSDHCVRVYMARSIATLFLEGCGSESCDRSVVSHVTLLPKEEQESIFENVSEMLKKAQMMESSQDELSAEDDSVNRVSTMIATVLYEACVSPVCEKKVVSLLITAVGQGQIDVELVRKALGRMACYLGYRGTRQLLEDMLISLVSSWMSVDLQLTDFPVRLMGYGSAKEFLSAYSYQIIPFLVSKCDEPTLESLSGLLTTPLPTLLKQSLPTSMVLILTNYALQDSLEGSQERKKKASESHNLLTRHLTEEVVSQTTKHSMDDFVVQLLARMSEPHHSHTDLAKYTLPSDPEPCSPHFTSRAVQATLEYIPSCYSNAGTSFVKLLSRRKDNIQRILLSLAVRIQTTHRSFEKRRYLLAYHLFVKLVCQELTSKLDNTRSFIIMDIVHTIVRILSSREEKEGRGSLVRELFALGCDSLELVCKATLQSCPEELTKHLHSVVAVLTPFAQDAQTPAGKQALSLLTYLLDTVDPEHVAHLDPFAKEEPFTQLSRKQTALRQEVGGATLDDEINRFLSVGRKCPHSMRSKALIFLQSLLHISKLELASLVKQGSTSPVLQLIQGLVSLCQGSPSSPSCNCDVSRCLGEIGPSDLGCIAIPTHCEGQGSFDTSSLPATWFPSDIYTAGILHHLGVLLLDKDISVVQASGECLRCILATKTGQCVLCSVEAQGQDVSEWCLYLEPFKQQRKTKAPGSAPAPTHPPPSFFTSQVDLPDLWIPAEGVSHKTWITRLVTTLIGSGAVTDEVLLLMEPVCKVKIKLCEEVFPLLIHNILSSNNNDYHRIVSGQIQLFFATVTAAPSSRPSTPSPSTQAHSTLTLNPDSVRTMLNMVMYLRTVDRPKKRHGSSHSVTTPWENNFWLDLNFLDVAMAAQLSASYFTSLLYIEIWHGSKPPPSPSNRRSGSSSSLSGIELMEIDPSQSVLGLDDDVNEPKVRKLLLEAYSRIGEPDSLYGACSTLVTDDMTRVRLYEHEGQWHKSLSSYSLQAQLPGASCESNIAESLHQLGLTPILNMYLCGVESVRGGGVSSGEVAEYQYEAAWRLTTWDDRPEGHASLHLASGGGEYHQNVFNCITALRDGERSLLENSLSEARSHVIRSLCSTGLESTYSLYPSLSKLLSLLELEEASQSTLSDHTPSSSQDMDFLKDWTDRLPYLDSDFQFVEPVLALRHSTIHCLLRAAGQEVNSHGDENVTVRRKVEGLFGAVRDNLLTQAKLAREAGRYQVAEGALFNLKQLHTHRGSFAISEFLCPSLSWRIPLEEAKLEWERGEGPLAMSLLKSLLQRFGQNNHLPPDVASLYPLALSLYGSWLADTQSESPSIIMSKYLEKSVSLMNELQHRADQSEVVNAYLTLARYADTQYQRIKRHMESPTFQNKKQLMERSKQDLQKLQSMAHDRQIIRHVRTLQAHSEEDEIAVDNLLGEKQHFLEKALQNYILCLKAGDDHDLRVFRLCALWFANSNHKEVNQIIKSGMCSLESRKFLPLMYQLAARMSARTLKSDPFQQVLQDIIYRTTMDHPHHCLYSILALSNASKDEKFPSSGHVTGTKSTGRTSGRLSRKSSISGGSVDEDKVKAAGDLISHLRKQKPTLVRAAEQLCDAYMDLAYHDVSLLRRKESGPFVLPSSCPLLKLGKDTAAVPTIDIDVDPTCCYDNVAFVDSFDPYFLLAGGVNLPKVISCVSTDGKRRRQLVKGKDDLRQDAVMQQVFVLVNRLLKKEPATSKRRLCVRTYKVIPLSQRSGIVEWCEGTCPLGEYLIGSSRNTQQGAHHRYQPSDWTSLDCRKKLMAASSDRRASKFSVYTEICKHFQPVFHHFFMEKFPSPPQWFERRLTYTRSVATSSIVGYLLGLGDRHVQNILIDTNTAEFVHIDLGVAFEQGKTLPTPETVPFRLTRDLVDGMGIAGVEGVFRRCCEKTTVLMRAHQEELRTIVEVLLHDPLYQWTLSPLKALNLQRAENYDDIPPTPSSSASRIELNGGQTSTTNGGNGTASNKMAERVLLRLQEKLGGIEDGVPLSVSGQVNRLIQEATDPANLCVLFPGWQPWI